MKDNTNFLEDLKTIKHFFLTAPDRTDVNEKIKRFEEKHCIRIPNALKYFYTEINIQDISALPCEIKILEIEALTPIYEKQPGEHEEQIGEGIVFAESNWSKYAYFEAEDSIMSASKTGIFWHYEPLCHLEEFLVYNLACGIIEQMSECVLVNFKKPKKNETIESISNMKHLKCNENPYYKILFNDDLKLLADYDDDRKMKFRIASDQPGAIDSIALTNKVLWKKHQGKKVVRENNKKQSLSDLTYEEKLQMIHKAFFSRSKFPKCTYVLNNSPRELIFFYSLIHENKIFRFPSESDGSGLSECPSFTIAINIREDIKYIYDSDSKIVYVTAGNDKYEYDTSLENFLIYLACLIAQEDAVSCQMSFEDFQMLKQNYSEVCQSVEYECCVDCKHKVILIYERAENSVCISGKDDDSLKMIEEENDIILDWN